MVRAVKKEAVARAAREAEPSCNGSDRQEAQERRVLRSRYLAVKNLISGTESAAMEVVFFFFSWNFDGICLCR